MAKPAPIFQLVHEVLARVAWRLLVGFNADPHRRAQTSQVIADATFSFSAYYNAASGRSEVVNERFALELGSMSVPKLYRRGYPNTEIIGGRSPAIHELTVQATHRFENTGSDTLGKPVLMAGMGRRLPLAR